MAKKLPMMTSPGVLSLRTTASLLTFDGADVVIRRFGARGGTYAYPLHQISGVQVTRPRFMHLGVFRIIVPGELAPRGRNKTGLIEVSDLFSVQFPKSGLMQAEQIATSIRAAQSALRQRQYAPQALPAPTPVPVPAPQLAEQLAQLAQLHASGALSDAEFAAGKAKLLGGPQA